MAGTLGRALSMSPMSQQFGGVAPGGRGNAFGASALGASAPGGQSQGGSIGGVMPTQHAPPAWGGYAPPMGGLLGGALGLLRKQKPQIDASHGGAPIAIEGPGMMGGGSPFQHLLQSAPNTQQLIGSDAPGSYGSMGGIPGLNTGGFNPQTFMGGGMSTGGFRPQMMQPGAPKPMAPAYGKMGALGR